MFKHSFEIPDVGQAVEMSSWLAEHNIRFSIYPVTDVIRIKDERMSKAMLLIAFDSDDEFASMFCLRWATNAANEG